MKYFLSFFLFLYTLFSIAQNKEKIDSLHQIINNSRNHLEIADAYYDISLRYYSTKDSIKKYAFKGLEYTQKYNIIEKEADAQNMLGIYYMRMRDVENAERAQLKSLELYRKLKDTLKTNIGRTHGGLGTIYRLKSQPKKAIAHLETAAKILNSNKDEYNLLKTYGRIGNLYDDLGRYKESEIAFRKAERLLNTKEYNAVFHYNVTISLGIALLRQGKNEQAQRYFKRSLELSNITGSAIMKADALENLGAVNLNLGNPEKAISYTLKADSIYIKQKDKEAEYRIKINLGDIYSQKEKYKTALNNYQKALKISKQIDFKTGILDSQSKMIKIFMQQNEFDKALLLSQKVLKESKSLKNIEFQTRALNSLGKIYQKHKKDYKKALEYYRKALIIAKNNNNAKAVIATNINIGKTYLKLKQYDNAIFFCEQAYNKGTISKYADLKIEACDCLVENYEKNDNEKEALKWIKIKTKTKDSIINFKKEIAFKEIETKHKVAKKDEKIANLTSEKISLENVLNKLIPIFALLIFGSLLLYFFYKKQKDRTAILEKETLVTSKKIDELKKIVIKNHIILKDKTKVYVSDLMYIKSEDHYLNLFLNNNKKHFVRGKLSQIKEELPPNFIQCHRSYIVNTNFIKQINSNSLTLINKTELPLSRSYKDKF